MDKLDTKDAVEILLSEKKKAEANLEKAYDSYCIFPNEHDQEDWNNYSALATAFEMAMEAMEKQIPQKPIRIDKHKEFDGNWKKVCPLCGRILIERITTSEKSYPRYYNYTEHCLCGQAIDWEEE